MEEYTVKLQIDIANQKVLIYSQNKDIFLEVDGDRAEMIVSQYDLLHERKAYCEAEVDQHGLLTLGKQLETEEW